MVIIRKTICSQDIQKFVLKYIKYGRIFHVTNKSLLSPGNANVYKVWGLHTGSRPNVVARKWVERAGELKS